MRSARQSRAVGRLLVARKVPTSKPPRVTRLNLSWLIRQDRLRSLTTEQGSSYARNEIFRNCQALSDVRGRRREIVSWIEPTSREQTHPYSALTSVLPGNDERVLCRNRQNRADQRAVRTVLPRSTHPRPLTLERIWVKKIHRALSRSWTSEKCQGSEGPKDPTPTAAWPTRQRDASITQMKCYHAAASG